MLCLAQLWKLTHNLITVSINNTHDRLNGTHFCKIFKLLDNDICDIIIGQKPQEIQDFHCLSMNLKQFTCNFTEPDNNVNTLYKLNFYRDNRPFNELKSQLNPESCPLIKMDGIRSCRMGLNIEPRYAANPEQYFHFNLSSENIFGSKFQIFSIPHFENVIFLPPRIYIVANSSHSVTIQWYGGNKLSTANNFCNYSYQNGSCLTYDVTLSQYKDIWFPVNFTNPIDIAKRNILHYQTEIIGLNPYTSYDIAMRIKAVNATDNLWSEKGYSKFQTLCSTPETPPKVDIGSFYINDNGYIHIYWKLLERHEENCANISYSLSTVSGKESIKSEYLQGSVIDLNITANDDYEFEIKSFNKMGYSKDGSKIKVPKEMNRFPGPRFLRNIVENGKYHFSWEPPENTSEIVDYTVFWCINDPNSAKHCKNGSIDFYHVNSSVTNITHDGILDNLEFAVSANSIGSSSGMIWSQCTAPIDTDILTLRPNIRAKTTSIHLSWKLECIQKTIIEQFVISWCRSDESTCDNKENITLSRNTEEFEIQNLNPYTEYNITIYSYSAISNKETVFTKTTSAAASSPPQNLTVRNITDTTVTLSWNRPVEIRGVLKHYDVFYNNKFVRIEIENDIKEEETYILKGLQSYTEYHIYVIAYTVRNSNHSDHIQLRTAIGTSGTMNQPKIAENQSEITISWEPPLQKSGRIEFYELRRITRLDGEPIEIEEYKILSTICRFNINQTCNSNVQNIFSIRAINIAPSINYFENNNHSNLEQKFEFQRIFDSVISNRNTTILNCENDKIIDKWLIKMNSIDNQSVSLIGGNWSSPCFSSACQYSESSNLFTFIIIGVLGVIVVLLFLTGIIVYSYRYYKKHSDIHFLPPGLDPPDYELDIADIYVSSDFQNDVSSRRSSSGFHEECHEYFLPQKVENERIDDKYIKNMDINDCLDLIAPDGYLPMNPYQEMKCLNLRHGFDSNSIRSSVNDEDKF